MEKTLAKRYDEKSKLVQMSKIVHKLVPGYLNTAFPFIPHADTSFSHDTHRKLDIPHFWARTDLFNKSYFPSSIRLWNLRPLHTRNAASLTLFKHK